MKIKSRFALSKTGFLFALIANKPLLLIVIFVDSLWQNQ
jgi:hypothetical protein